MLTRWSTAGEQVGRGAMYFPAVPVLRWLTVLLCLLQGGYMLLDGCRALVVGTYITPSAGEHAG